MGNRRTYERWKPKELEWLRQNGPHLTSIELTQQMPRHTRWSILWKARKLGITLKPIKKTSTRYKTYRSWSEADLAYLKKHAERKTIKELASEMGRTYHSILRKTGQLGQPVKLERPTWPKSDKLKLIQWAERFSPKMIAQRLGRSEEAVRWMMKVLKVSPYQGTYSLTRAMEATGYAAIQLTRARDALGMHWKRRPHSWTESFVITEHQLERLCEYLKYEGTPQAQELILRQAVG